MRPRRLAAWLLSFPLMVVGSQVAHVLAYSWVYPNAHVRLSELLSSGHGYMGRAYAPILLGFVFAAELVASGWVLAGAVRRGRPKPVPASAFALLPIVGFALQELLERLLAGAPLPWLVVLTPTFRVGLLLQLPFALAAYLLARFLLRAAERAGRALRGSVARPSAQGASLRWLIFPAQLPWRAAPADQHSGRGPPPAHAIFG